MRQLSILYLVTCIWFLMISKVWQKIPMREKVRSPMPLLLRNRLIALFVGVLIAASPVANADPIDPDRAWALKTAYIYNFVKYTQWPADRFEHEETPIQICVIGESPLVRQIEDLTRKKLVGKHPLVLRHIPVLSIDPAIGGLAEEITEILLQSDVIYFSFNLEDWEWELVATLTQGTSKLTIGDCHERSGHTLMIRFVTKDDRIGFEVDLEAVEKEKIRLSSKLLVLSTFVKKNGGSK